MTFNAISRWRLAAYAFAVLAGVGAKSCVGVEPMTPVEFLSLPSIGDLCLSPSGDLLAYLKIETDWEANAYRRDLWLCDRASGRSRQLTFDRQDLSHPRWSPSGAQVAFLADPPGSREDEVYLLALEGGDARRLTVHPTTVLSFEWAPGGKSLYYRAKDPWPSQDEKVGIQHYIEPFERPSHTHLWRVDVATGKRTRITDGEFVISSFSLSQDGETILLERHGGSRIDDKYTSTELVLIDADGGNERLVSQRDHEHSTPQLSPDGKRICFIADVNAEGESYYQANLFVQDIDITPRKAPTLLLPNSPHEIIAAQWVDSHTLAYLANTGTRTQLFEIDLETGHVRRLTRGEHNLELWSYCRAAEQHVFCRVTAASPGEAWTLARHEGAALEQVTHVFDGVSGRFALPGQVAVRWHASDGVQVEGLLSMPLGDPKRPVPLIVSCHGGPRSSDRFGLWNWRRCQPVYAALGYATFTVNYRGSTGYGEQFHRDMVGDYFRNSHTDVLSGVDHLVAQGVADPERLGVSGWSAGGHMVNKLITVTDRFRAASSGAGAVDWVSMYGESDTRYLRTHWFGGAPWEEDAPLDAYIRQSPLKDTWQATTPTIIFVGEEDERVPATQSILLSRALTANNVPNQLYIANGQEHDWRTPKTRLFKILAEIEWFEKHIRHRSYDWQQPPED